MDLETVKGFWELLSTSPGLALLVVLAGLVTWAIKTDALGFVSRRKRQRRADVFDTYEKLASLGALTDEERVSVVAELREAGEGLRGLSREPEPGGDKPEAEPEVQLPPVTKHTVRVADGVLSLFVGLLLAAMPLMFLGMTVLGLSMLATPGGGVQGVVVGLVMSVGGVWSAVKVGSGLLRDLAGKFPRRLRRVAEGLDWLGRRTQTVRTLGLLGFLGLGYLFVVVALSVATYSLAAESESFVGVTAAVGVGALTLAIAVKGMAKVLWFLGVFDSAEAQADPGG